MGSCSRLRIGVSILELTVTLAIIGILAAILLPAIQRARESARSTHCKAQLSRIGLALQNYLSLHSEFPPGANYNGYSFHTITLPFLEQQTLYDEIKSAFDAPVETVPMPEAPRHLRCPSDGQAKSFATNYAGNFGSGVQRYGYNGMLCHIALGPQVSHQAVRSGTSNVVIVAEILPGIGSPHQLRSHFWTDPLGAPEQLDEFAIACKSANGVSDNSRRGIPWFAGNVGVTLYNHILPPNSPSCINGVSAQIGCYSAASLHPGGVNAVYADGHVGFVTETIETKLWRMAGSRYPINN